MEPIMKTPILIAAAIILGVMATNLLIKPRNNVVEKAEKVWMTDEVDTSQAAPKNPNGGTPL
jgi:hypothetical protein